MTTGVGTFVAGLLLTYISFPTQTDVVDVSPEAIEGLGMVGGSLLLVLYLIAIIFLFFYPITKERYHEIRAGLDKRYMEM